MRRALPDGSFYGNELALLAHKKLEAGDLIIMASTKYVYMSLLFSVLISNISHSISEPRVANDCSLLLSDEESKGGRI